MFVFSEAHLKAKPVNMDRRVVHTKTMREFFNYNYHSLPVFVAGDFNEESHNPPISEVMKSKFIDLYTIKQQQIGEESEEHPAMTTFKYRKKDGGWTNH